MHILFNTWRDLVNERSGGSERAVDRLASGLHARGHEVTLRAGGPTGSHRFRTLDGGGTYDQYLRTAVQLRRLRSSAPVDVVVDVNHGMGFYSPWLADLPVVAMVPALHTDHWPLHFAAPAASLGAWQERVLQPWAYRQQLVVVPTRSTALALVDIGIRPDRLRTLPFATDVRPTTPRVRKDDAPLFVALGRLSPYKHVDVLLEAWERVRPVTRGRLVVIGDGPELAALRSMAGVDAELAGSVDDRTRNALLARAWLLVHASDWEGWAMAITEAAALGTPTLAIDAPGVRDAVDDTWTGRLVGDPDELASVWCELAADPAQRDRLGRRAEGWATSRAVDDQVFVFEEVLQEAIDIHAGSGRPRPMAVLGRASVHHPGPSDVRASLQAARPPRPSPFELSIVIPAFDEARRLPRLFAQLRATDLDRARIEILVVDDGSRDDTVAVAHHELADFPNGYVIELDRNRGKGAALRAGVLRARGATIVTMDADGATDLAALAPVIDALRDHELAVGSRIGVRSQAVRDPARRLVARAMRGVVAGLTQSEVADTQCGFKAFRAFPARLLFHAAMADGFGQDAELLDLAAQMSWSVAEIPVAWDEVPGSKIRIVRDSTRTLGEVLAHRFHLRPTPLVTGLVVHTRHTAQRLSGPSAQDPTATLAEEIAPLVRIGDGLTVDGRSVVITTPGADLPAVERLATRISDHLPAVSVARWSTSFDRYRRWWPSMRPGRVRLDPGAVRRDG